MFSSLKRECKGPIFISVALPARAKRTVIEHAQLELLCNVFSSLLHARSVSKVESVSTFLAKRSDRNEISMSRASENQ